MIAYQNRSIRFTSLICAVTLAVSFGTMASAQSMPGPMPVPVANNPVVNGNLQLALNLYHFTAASQSSGNFVYSPYSIMEAFAFTDAGAHGNTDSQIRQALGVGLSQADLPAAMLALRTDLLTRGNYGNENATPVATPFPPEPPARVLRLANALWGEQTYPFNKSFIDIANIDYGGALRQVDFINNAEASRKQINDWVAQVTDNHIPEIASPDIINASTRTALFNAVYFNSRWDNQPFVQETQNRPFTLLDTTQKPVQVPMMRMTDPTYNQLNYVQGDHYQAVEIPYANFGTMLIILPDQGQYAAVEKSLDTPMYNSIIAGMKLQTVLLTMPRFTVNYGLDLKTAMQSFGVTDAFDPNAADLSGMGSKGLYVQAAIHQAFIKIDESGTTAAASSGAVGVPTGFFGTLITLDINRPFIFVLRDPQTGAILFMGRVLNPLG